MNKKNGAKKGKWNKRGGGKSRDGEERFGRYLAAISHLTYPKRARDSLQELWKRPKDR
jgi:hypothetical protein